MKERSNLQHRSPIFWVFAVMFIQSLGCNVAGAASLPAPYGPTPTALQLRWHELEYYGFAHFGVDTFTGKEWGYGDEDPKRFNPTAFDADQIAAAAKAGGMKGLILVAKHHDGLCLWPTKSTPHNISATPYKNGKGDIVREMSEACKKAGIKFGVYVSPWDRNHPEFGRPGYVAAYHQQISELTSNYGPIFEMWFDAAFGGDGYYGGTRERRKVDYDTYYGWKDIRAMIRKNQPDCAIWLGMYAESNRTVFAEARYGGNEYGNVGDPCWHTLDSKKMFSAYSDADWHQGVRNGDVWCGAEADTSIRGGWFWHEGQNAHVKSPQQIMDNYLTSVGRGANYLLNIPPDTRGLIHENDVSSLAAFGKHLRATFAQNLASGAKAIASNVRGNDVAFGPERLLDSDQWSAWITDDEVKTSEVVLDLNGEKTFTMIRLREDIRLGQRVEGVAVDAFMSGQWKEIASAPCVGASRLWRVPKITTGKVRIRVTKAAACPALSDCGLFLEPEFEMWLPPIGADPKVLAAVKAKTNWKVTSVTHAAFGREAKRAIDGNPGSFWHGAGPAGEELGLPQDFTVDMGGEKTLKGFTYLPRQDHCFHGMVDQYVFALSVDGKTWTTVSEGEFGNLRTNPVEQTMSFAPVKARYFKFTAKHALEMNHAVVAEVGVIE